MSDSVEPEKESFEKEDQEDAFEEVFVLAELPELARTSYFDAAMRGETTSVMVQDNFLDAKSTSVFRLDNALTFSGRVSEVCGTNLFFQLPDDVSYAHTLGNHSVTSTTERVLPLIQASQRQALDTSEIPDAASTVKYLGYSGESVTYELMSKAEETVDPVQSDLEDKSVGTHAVGSLQVEGVDVVDAGTPAVDSVSENSLSVKTLQAASWLW